MTESEMINKLLISNEEAEKDIIRLNNACNELMDIVQNLQEYNDFLIETINNKKMGTLTIERKKILDENRELKATAKSTLNEAAEIKNEYENKLEKISEYIEEIQLKRSEIDSYINSEAENKINIIKAEYKKKDRKNNKILEQQKKENEKILKEQLEKVNLKNKLFVVIGILGTAIGIIGIII